MISERLTSAQNPKVKALLELQTKSRARRDSGLFPLEGKREIEHCLEAGYSLKTVFFCPDIYGSAEPSFDAPQIFEVNRIVYEKIALRDSTEGIVGVFEARTHSLDELKLGANPLVAVLESVEKPGNLGAVLRSADAAGADAVIICDPLTDIYNPNLIRSSIGAAFTVQTAVCSTAEAIKYLKSRKIKILTAQLQDSELYYDSDFAGPTAIVMGTESTGLGDEWRLAADAHIRIPMLGRLDSLNVSVSAAILLFEAVRQRKTGK